MVQRSADPHLVRMSLLCGPLSLKHQNFDSSLSKITLKSWLPSQRLLFDKATPQIKTKMQIRNFILVSVFTLSPWITGKAFF